MTRLPQALLCVVAAFAGGVAAQCGSDPRSFGSDGLPDAGTDSSSKPGVGQRYDYTFALQPNIPKEVCPPAGAPPDKFPVIQQWVWLRSGIGPAYLNRWLLLDWASVRQSTNAGCLTVSVSNNSTDAHDVHLVLIY